MLRLAATRLAVRTGAVAANGAAVRSTSIGHVSLRALSVTAARMQASPYAPLDTFARRHIGPTEAERETMLSTIGAKSIDELIDRTIPKSIRVKEDLKLEEPLTEQALLAHLRKYADDNQVWRSFIGMGYYNTFVPNVILRNVMENPGWYTQYTPYQPEISQGRLESLLNFQTVVTDLTGLHIANASLLDEGTAAAEGMMMSFAFHDQSRHTFFVDEKVHPQTLACIRTRAEPFNIKIVVGDYRTATFGEDLAGALVQYPTTDGSINDYKSFADNVHKAGGLFVVGADLLALTVLTPPAEFGADVCYGSAQRFGVPLGYGGPHAAFFATTNELKRRMPGRLIGVSKDAKGNVAMRLALQTREQHIRRENATSNICTAQALLANMAAMYAVYHGADGLRGIARRTHFMAASLAEGLRQLGHTVQAGDFFDTIAIKPKGGSADAVIAAAAAKHMNLRKLDDKTVTISVDETTSAADLEALFAVFADGAATPSLDKISAAVKDTVPSKALARTTPFLEHPVFNLYHSETEMLRYIMRLQNKDLSLTTSMIALGSCTMKLNATTEMVPITWPEFNSVHPYAPAEQAKGYARLFADLERDLAEITGFDGVSLQPNSGANGEFTGLMCIREYHKSRNEGHRNVCLIPVSAHGTNPASANLCGYTVVPVACHADGRLDLADVKAKAEKHRDNLAAIMITYPSTYGVFEDGVRDACDIIHANGGQVYLDGANMNAQVGLCRPGDYGADVCHLNLHKTFCIPHGGGGPGMGPIGAKKHLAQFFPSHPVTPNGNPKAIGPVAAASYSSASILPIPWAYIRMMGTEGLRLATQTAILNANYMKARLEKAYSIRFVNDKGMCAHEFIIDLRAFKNSAGIEAIDVAKRLQDYGFHSPTMSFPVPGSLMIEPTESEGKAELDRFCDAMLSIREEIAQIESGKVPRTNNILKNAPHPAHVITGDEWTVPYTREQAAYPLPYVRANKFWPATSRLDDAFGDRNLMCTCPPMDTY